VSKDADTPWDARLVERMSRRSGSARAPSGRPLYFGLCYGAVTAAVAGIFADNFLAQLAVAVAVGAAAGVLERLIRARRSGQSFWHYKTKPS
jgi:hypothetical protein